MSANLYEHPAWAELQDYAMHPGGLSATAQVLAACDYPPESIFLDVGCGSGATLKFVHHQRHWNGFGIDLSHKLLSRVHQKDRGFSLAQARAEQLPFADESMDVVNAECTLSLFNYDSAVREFVRVLKPTGTLIISDLYARNADGLADLRKLPPGTCIQAVMSQSQIEDKIESSEMQIIEWHDCSSRLKEFSLCTLVSATAIDPFDLHIAAARSKLGYFFLYARKRGEDSTWMK